MSNWGSFVLALCCVLGFAGAPLSAATSFEGIGNAAGESYAYGVSGDGTVVVGRAQQAFRWTHGGGTVLLNGLGFDDSLPYSAAVAASYDGAVIGGETAPALNHFGWPVRWTSSSDTNPPAIAPVESHPGRTSAISADGRFAAGHSWAVDMGIGNWAYRWNLADNSRTLIGRGAARGMSADGSVVAGHTESEPVVTPPFAFLAGATAAAAGTAPSEPRAFRWTESGGRTLIGDPGAARSGASAISADGTTIVGSNVYDADAVTGRGTAEAFRWTAEGGWRSLGDEPAGWVGSEALGVSGDGSVIVGSLIAPPPVIIFPAAPELARAASTPVVDEAFIWDAAHGMRNLKDVLEDDFGLDLTGWTLSSATGISWDGTVIVGNGFNPAGQHQAWVATVPEPSGGALLGIGGVALLRRRHNSR